MATSKRLTKDMYHILLIDFHYNGKEDYQTEDAYPLDEVCKVGDALKVEMGYPAYKIVKKVKKRTKSA